MKANQVISEIKLTNHTVYNYFINVADYETKTVKISGESVEEAEKYAVMAGFEITAPTVKAEAKGTWTEPGGVMPASGDYMPSYNHLAVVVIDINTKAIESAEWVK